MDFTLFRESLSMSAPPDDISVYLEALWQDAKGNWSAAHHLIQDIEDKNASWIHAYLHRKEGDIWNADYWYRKAGRQRPSIGLQQEWEQITQSFL